MEAARKQIAEQKEKKEAQRVALLRKIAELEQEIADDEPFGAMPQATIPGARRLRRTETYIEVPSSDAEERVDAMEVDGTDREEFKLDSEEEPTDKEDDQPKENARVGNPVLGKRKATAKGGDEAEGQKDSHGEEQGKKKKKSKTQVRDEIDKVREQMVKVREGAEVAKEPVIGPKDSAQSVIDQQCDGGKSAGCNPKGYVPELFVLTVCYADP
jgi:hypothetical protein